jgi:hypothetical protein
VRAAWALLLLGCTCAGTPPFKGTQKPLPPDVRERMDGTSWREGCPVPLEKLRLLEVMHWGFDGKPKTGRLVVAAEVAGDFLKAFKALYAAKFPIEQLRLVDDFEGRDELSMDANNTSAFNCRALTGQKVFSPHSYGLALDVNPVQNPYIKGDTLLPPSGAAFRNRQSKAMGLLRADDEAVKIFKKLGFVWGGDWTSLKDYQHFEKKRPKVLAPMPVSPPATP